MDSEQGNIWQLFTRGDAKSLEQIYMSYYDMLLKYGYKFTGHLPLIEESIQALFIKMWSNRGSLKEPVSIKYYLLKAFRNTLVRQLQVQSRLNTRTETFEVVHFHLQESPEEQIIQREEHKRQQAHMKQLLNTLTNRQKEAIYLRFYEELSYEDISAILGIDIGATYKLIYRAIDRLREWS